ncbi:methionine ABC transporter ATP-binding protein [Caproicibacterium amylolyticum]|jgi:D-methionine transport system ATP-binding protein|uniref:ATP-binding cassette domain-containing protein n=1 Tax=Caproicibacterium amylolyticum TaxID=2766537 RepID=A0A7G9WFU0_9FIRM|nr:ATP-binding cassette domain-containing protein [Caproicibacterium amylolyticum]QNO17552.1 ATP-binding cassette domain-containing protein [Caproicibacterium amylolyticum]
MIQFVNVSKEFVNKDDNVHALRELSLTVEKGDIFGVIGFSGAGKSTLLRMVNALETPTAGQVLVQGQNLAQLSPAELRKTRKEIAMVFQQFNLLDSRTVFDNVAMPLKLNHVPKAEIAERVEELLKFVELSDKRNAYPQKLSGGQKQRVGIARALATQPSILLCDEPTSALDPKTTDSILQLLQKVNRELGVTILIITHQISVIQKICNRVAVMENGRVAEQGTVLEVFSHPKAAITKDFVSTVIDDRIPESIQKSLATDARNNTVIRLHFLGSNSREAMVSAINKKFNVETNILFASVHELQNTVLGTLVLQLVGSSEEIAAVEAYIQKSDVDFEEAAV